MFSLHKHKFHSSERSENTLHMYFNKLLILHRSELEEAGILQWNVGHTLPDDKLQLIT
jgi:hypothetical protein